jgi:hypothetical protein
MGKLCPVYAQSYRRAKTPSRSGPTNDFGPGPVFQADHLGLYLGLSVRSHALQLVRLVQGMMVRYPVHRRRRDVHHPFYPVAPGRFENVAGPLDVRGVDVLRGVERQRRRRVDHEIHTLHRPIHERLVADIALYDLDPALLWIAELLDVQRSERVSALDEVPDEVDPQEPRSAGDKDLLSLLGFHRIGLSFCVLDSCRGEIVACKAHCL